MENKDRPINARVAFDKEGEITTHNSDYYGLTKREYTAIQILQGLAANPDKNLTLEIMPLVALELTDKLLELLENKSNP